MSNETTTPEKVVKNQETVEAVKEEAPAVEVKEEVKKEETLGATLVPAKEQKEKPTVGLDKFLDQKRVNKELKAKLETLQETIENGASKKEVSRDIQTLAKENNVDPEFLQNLSEAIRSEAEQSIEERLQPFTEREAVQKREELFAMHMKNTLEEMPEYAGVINENILKQLAFNPSNANKTFRQLVEETYGNVVGSKKTIETAVPQSDIKASELDYDKANTDPDYFKQVMSNPETKAKYNQEMLNRMG